MDRASGRYEHRSDDGLTAAVIRRVVEAFYAKARQDDVLGPVFNGLVEDWDAHIEKVGAFWLYATRLDGTYNSRDFMPAHLRHAQIEASLLPRWLVLFRRTATEICTPGAAEILIDIAERMAASIEMSLARRPRPGVAGPDVGEHHAEQQPRIRPPQG
jgi:hemoglobin